MPFTDTENLGGFYGQVRGLWVNTDVQGWHSDYFLRLDDDGTDTTDDSYYDGNSLHTLEVYSEVSQTVHIQGNLWNYRAYPYDCRLEAAQEFRSRKRNYALVSAGR